MYVLIIITFVGNGITASQHAYNGKASCESAAQVVVESANVVKRNGSSYLKTSCVPQDISRP